MQSPTKDETLETTVQNLYCLIPLETTVQNLYCLIPLIIISNFVILCQIIYQANKRLYSRHTTQFNLEIVIFNDFQVIFAVSTFVGTPVYLR